MLETNVSEPYTIRLPAKAKIRIAIADDHPIFRDGLCQTSRPCGCHYRWRHDQGHARSHCRARSPVGDRLSRVQAAVRHARQTTNEHLAFDKTVTVKVRDIDRYKRTVAEVILPDGRNLNQELVRVGT
jgi:hypothetical protein